MSKRSPAEEASKFIERCKSEGMSVTFIAAVLVNAISELVEDPDTPVWIKGILRDSIEREIA